MSLPTHALFYNAADELIAKQFVNVGWWLAADTFVEAVMDLAWVRDAKYIILYGIRVEVALLEKPEDIHWKDWRDKQVASATPVIQQWSRDNADLREVLKKIYIEANGAPPARTTLGLPS